MALSKPMDARGGGYGAIGELLHRYLTGLILAMVVEVGTDRSAKIVKSLFRRQQEERFLPGLQKLGLAEEPDAVACAKYHYLSNHLGGVSVVYVAESDSKAWVKYVPPRWIFDGAAIAGIPTEISRAMLWGWHANNGVLLGNPCLGFVCTGQTVDAMPGLEGYYIQEQEPLPPEKRLRFRFGESCPPIVVENLPTLDSDDWPAERRAKAARNYSMDYIRNLVPVIAEELGPIVAQGLLRRTGRKIGMQYSSVVREKLGTDNPGEILAGLLEAQGDVVTLDGNEVTQETWRLMRGLEAESTPEWMDGISGLWEGVLEVLDPEIRLELPERLDSGDDRFLWRLSRLGRPTSY